MTESSYSKQNSRITLNSHKPFARKAANKKLRIKATANLHSPPLANDHKTYVKRIIAATCRKE